MGEYYLPRWSVFLDYLAVTGPLDYDAVEAKAGVKEVEVGFQTRGLALVGEEIGERSVRSVIEGEVVGLFKEIGLS